MPQTPVRLDHPGGPKGALENEYVKDFRQL